MPAETASDFAKKVIPITQLLNQSVSKIKLNLPIEQKSKTILHYDSTIPHSGNVKQDFTQYLKTKNKIVEEHNAERNQKPVNSKKRQKELGNKTIQVKKQWTETDEVG